MPEKDAEISEGKAPGAEPSDLDSLTQEVNTAQDQEVGRLSEQLEHQKDRRKEDWFVFLLVLIILLNIHVFGIIDGWGAVSITFLQLILLLVAADRFGVKPVVSWFTYIIDKFGRNTRAD